MLKHWSHANETRNSASIIYHATQKSMFNYTLVSHIWNKV